ncbi:MAG TPA: DUF58 domain-containing protein [Planctomycetota bacterium]|nr:DUF58 domain-containing protein [Planctomycetota bacterium]
MADVLDTLDHNAMQRVAGLQLVARTVVESFISGQHRSVYKGFSIEFAQHRQYARGDELRHIDWKVYGKSDRLFIKQYEEETNVRATIVLDASGSMKYGSGKETKFQYARNVAAALSYLMVGQSDSVGLVTFDTAVRRQVPPRSTTSHLSNLFKVMMETEPGNETNLAKILHNLTGQIKRRGLVIVISDLFSPVEDLKDALAHFHHQRHEVILLQILDPNEVNFPFESVAEFRSLERAGHKIKLDAARVRKHYLERFENFSRNLREACHRFHYDHVQLTTDQPFDAALTQYLMRRGGR